MHSKKEMTVVGNKQNAFCNFWEVWSYVLDMNYHSKNLSRPEFSIFQKSSIRQLMSCPKITSWSKSQISTIVGIVEVTSYCFLRAYRLWNANNAAKLSFFQQKWTQNTLSAGQKRSLVTIKTMKIYQFSSKTGLQEVCRCNTEITLYTIPCKLTVMVHS